MGRYLISRVRVIYAGLFEKILIDHYGAFIGRDFDPAENVNVLISTLVMLYSALAPLLYVEL